MAKTTRARRGEQGISIVESLVAVTILALAIVLSIQPVMSALGWLDESRSVSTAENLAQALDYEDVGIPGYTPSGILEAEKTVVADNREYVVTTEVTYAGSLTGLTVIEQGGDGVQGSWDPGVDYKVVRVTVTTAGRGDPVIMETIVAPTTIGAHENIANARVYMAAYEPFVSSGYTLPELQVHSSPAPAIRSGSRSEVQVFPAIPAGDYVVEVASFDGWLLHPDDVTSGANLLDVTEGHIADATLRVFRPARLILSVTDAGTGLPVSGARLSLIHNPSGVQTDYAPGTTMVDGLVPDAYDVSVSASGYEPFLATSVNIPGNYPVPDHHLSVSLEPAAGGGGTTQGAVMFSVLDHTGRPVHQAALEVTHATLGSRGAVTGPDGTAVLDLELGESFTASASTPWGHGPASVPFTAGNGLTVTIHLSQPAGMGTLACQGGEQAEFVYRAVGATSWTTLPANIGGEATVVLAPGTYDVAKRCLGNGQITGESTRVVTANTVRTVSVNGVCP
jgi:hypothetical protein